tara:strand:- start:116444 stop:116833 length:390 start_codon:yes stop_codon:yes gene_type:complete
MRSKNAEVIQVSDETAKMLISFGHVHTFPVESDLFYEGQIPFVAYLIIEGKVHFSKNRRNKGTAGAGSLIGFKELYFHTPSTIAARVYPDTKVCYLDRSAILEIMESVETEDDINFSNFFKEQLLEKAL